MLHRQASRSNKSRRAAGTVLICLAVLLISGLGLQWWANRHRTTTSIGGETFNLQLASTAAEREKGLSGQGSLDSHGGMLFVFPTPGKPCIWMKEMHFNLDVLWLDASSKVVDQIQNVAPVTYPNEYCPESLSRYIIELPAGTIKRLKLQNGTVVALPKL